MILSSQGKPVWLGLYAFLHYLHPGTYRTISERKKKITHVPQNNILRENPLRNCLSFSGTLVPVIFPRMDLCFMNSRRSVFKQRRQPVTSSFHSYGTAPSRAVSSGSSRNACYKCGGGVHQKWGPWPPGPSEDALSTITECPLSCSPREESCRDHLPLVKVGLDLVTKCECSWY